MSRFVDLLVFPAPLEHEFSGQEKVRQSLHNFGVMQAVLIAQRAFVDGGGLGAGVSGSTCCCAVPWPLPFCGPLGRGWEAVLLLARLGETAAATKSAHSVCAGAP